MRHSINRMSQKTLASIIAFRTALHARVAQREGQALVEYALILALVAIVVIGVLTFLGSSVKSTLTNVNNAIGGNAP